MSIRTVLFDLFGTLVPCYPLRAVLVVVDQMALDVGIPADVFRAEWIRSSPRRFRGEFVTLEDNLIHVLERLGSVRHPGGIAEAVRRRIAFERVTLQPRPDAASVLHRLRSRGVRVGLVSNCSLETVLAWPECSLARHIDHATFSCTFGVEKPDPAIYLEALGALESAPEESLFVGDGSAEELAGAEGVGMRAMLIRGEDDDGTFPDRIDSSAWHGPAISRLSEVAAFVDRS